MKPAEPGYPARFYAERWRSRIWLCYPVGVVVAFTAGYAYVLWAGVGSPVHWVALAFVLFLLVSFIRSHIHAWRKARIYPYYDRPLANSGTYLQGQSLLRNLRHLDRLAESRGLRSISSFGFPDALRGETVVWHAAVEGRRMVEDLARAVVEQPDAVDDAPAVLADLERIRNALERAEAEGIRFSLLIEEMGGTSGLVWDRRGGSV